MMQGAFVLPDGMVGKIEASAMRRPSSPCTLSLSSTTVPGASPDKPAHVWAWNYQVACYDDIDENLVYWFTKQLHENYNDYKDKHAILKDWTAEHNLSSQAWKIPRHKGHVRYFKDIGMWTPEMEARQRELLAKYPQTMTRLD